MYQLSHIRPGICMLAVLVLISGLGLSTALSAGDAVFVDTAQIKVSGARSGSNLGKSVSGAGDVNMDGYKDAILGAPDSDNDSDGRRGHAYIVLGSPNIETEIDLKNPTHFITILYRCGLHFGAYGRF